MEKISKGIVFSDDIKRILNGINSFDFKYDYVPQDDIIDSIRSDFRTQTNKIFDNNVTIVSEEEMMNVNSLINGDCPIVTLDKIFISPDEENIYFLDCTRVSGTDEIISRKKEALDDQIIRISNSLKEKNHKDIIIADDVVFTGGVLKRIIEKFKENGINTISIVASISAYESYNYFNSNLKNGIKTNYVMGMDVIDQICERDFYFGIAGSGIMVETEKGMFKAPYFIPYGDPAARASIPDDCVKEFSIGCLDRSIYLWNEIDRLKKAKTLISELPEKIINTNENDEVVKSLILQRRNL